MWKVESIFKESILVKMDYNREKNIHNEDILCHYDRNKYKEIMT